MGCAHFIRPPPLGARAFYTGAAPLRPSGPTPRALSGFDFIGFADEIVAGWAAPILSGHHPSAPELFTQGLRPYGPPGLPRGLCRGLISSASPMKSWPDGLRPFYPATTPRRPSFLHRGCAPTALRAYPAGFVGV